jgi:hypothetical protein
MVDITPKPKKPSLPSRLFKKVTKFAREVRSSKGKPAESTEGLVDVKHPTREFVTRIQTNMTGTTITTPSAL